MLKQVIQPLVRSIREFRFHALALVIFVLVLALLRHSGYLAAKAVSEDPLLEALPFALNLSQATLLSGTVTSVVPVDKPGTSHLVLISTELDKQNSLPVRLGTVLIIPKVGYGVVTNMHVQENFPENAGKLILTISTHSSILTIGDQVKLYTIASVK